MYLFKAFPPNTTKTCSSYYAKPCRGYAKSTAWSNCFMLAAVGKDNVPWSNLTKHIDYQISSYLVLY